MALHGRSRPHRGRDFLIRRAFRHISALLVDDSTGTGEWLTDKPGGNFHNLGWREWRRICSWRQNMTPSFPSVVGPLWSLPGKCRCTLFCPPSLYSSRRFDRLSAVLALWLISTLVMTATTQPPAEDASRGNLSAHVYWRHVTYRLMNRRNDEPNRRRASGMGWPFFILSLFAVQGLLGGRALHRSPFGLNGRCSRHLLSWLLPFQSFR